MRRILISDHPGWTPAIANAIDPAQWSATFADLSAVPLDGYDAVLPLRTEHYAMVREGVARGVCRAILPTAAVTALCDDKLALSRFLIDRGLSRHVPALYHDRPIFPCILKPRHGEFGVGCRVLHEPEPVPAGSFLQELIYGEDEFAIHVLRVGGDILYLGGTGNRMAGPAMIRGGEHAPVKRWHAGVATLKPLIGRLLDEVGYEGTACLGIKLRDRTPVVIEINPRFGASLAYDFSRYVVAYCDALGA